MSKKENYVKYQKLINEIKNEFDNDGSFDCYPRIDNFNLLYDYETGSIFEMEATIICNDDFIDLGDLNKLYKIVTKNEFYCILNSPVDEDGDFTITIRENNVEERGEF